MYNIDTPALIRSTTKTKLPLLFVVAMLFLSTDTLLFGTNISVIARWIPYFFYCAVTLIIGYKAILKKAITTKAFVFYCVVVVSQIMTLIINDDNFVMTCFRIALITAAIVITLSYSFHDFAYAFEKVVFFLCVYSVAIYILCFIFPDLISRFPIITNVSRFKYYLVGPCIVPGYGGIGGVFRNHGIFREPGVFQMYISIALCIHLFYSEKRNLKRVILYFLTMVTTISTAGIACLLVCLFVYFTSNSKEKSEKQFKALALVSLLLCAAFLVISFGQTIDSSIGVMFGKLDADSTTHGSAVARLSSVTSNIHIWKTSPLFGVGLDNSDRLFDYFTRLDYAYYYSINITGTHNTNTYLYQLATYGMFFWGVFTLGLFKVSKLIAARKNSLIVSIFIFILFLFIYMDENLYYSLLPLVLMFFGLNEGSSDAKMLSF